MRTFICCAFVILLAACNGPEARRPIEAKSGSFFKESVERSKRVLAAEQAAIEKLIKKDTSQKFITSAYGFWYTYQKQNDTLSYTAKPDDLVQLRYNVLSIANDTIYTKAEIDTINYVVDKQQLFPGLRNSVKLLKEGEEATFYYPSSLAYGYHGDNDKIGPRVPLKVNLEILKVVPYTDSLNVKSNNE